MLPYSREVYYYLFGELNSRFTLFQIGALVLSLFIAFLLLRPPRAHRQTLLLLLSALWVGSAYFWFFRIFAEINFLAPVYAAFVAAQALGLATTAFLPGSSEHPPKINRTPSAILISLALIWPCIDLMSGPGWPMVRIMGLHTVPLLLLTYASLIHFRTAVSLSLGVIPLLLSAVCAYEAYVLHLPQDWLPLLATLLTAILLIRSKVDQ